MLALKQDHVVGRREKECGESWSGVGPTVKREASKETCVSAKPILGVGDRDPFRTRLRYCRTSRTGRTIHLFFGSDMFTSQSKDLIRIRII
jgi:hypothetical protein